MDNSTRSVQIIYYDQFKFWEAILQLQIIILNLCLHRDEMV